MNKLPGLIGSLAVLCLFCSSGVSAQVAAGGIYNLDQAVVAGGDGKSGDAGNLYRLEGTGGQPAAGASSAGGGYAARGGFWSSGAFVPTAAGASVGGRVVGPSGGLRNITVILSGGALLAPRQARTNSFGYFTFENVEVGQTYVVSVKNRKYGFAQDSHVISLIDNVGDIVFEAAWEN